MNKLPGFGLFSSFLLLAQCFMSSEQGGELLTLLQKMDFFFRVDNRIVLFPWNTVLSGLSQLFLKCESSKIIFHRVPSHQANHLG